MKPTAYPIAGAGYPFIFTGAFITLIFALMGWDFFALLGMAGTIFVCYFFRDPDRCIPEEEKAVVSPADGKIVCTGVVESNPFIEGPCIRVGIFMNLFNVHINRAPYSGQITKIIYKPGHFLPADRDAASLSNEHNAVIMKIDQKRKICFVQIAGLIARRIICTVAENEMLNKGQKTGLICFGSRVDVYLPPDASLDVRAGDRVRGGSSILAHLE